jgi:hypothetical protein
MSRLYFFHCTDCQEKWFLYEEQSGWLDQTGKIGYTLTIDNEPDGKFTGDWQFITIFDAICLGCNIIHGIVIKDSVSGFYSKINQESYNHPILIAPKFTVKDGSIEGHEVFTFQNVCNNCQGELLTASQLVEKSLITRESRILGLKPNDTSKNLALCPHCQQAKITFHHALRYHK